MASKFNYQTSQTIAIKEPSIDTQVQRLKRELNKVHNNYQESVYKILMKIMTLRRRQIRNYDIGDLAREKGIEMSFSSIQYIMLFQYLSSQTRSLIDKGKLKTSTALFIVRQDLRYREPEIQNIIIGRYLSGELNTSQISRIRSSILLDNVEVDIQIKDADDDLIKSIFRLQEIEKCLKTQKDYISNGNELILFNKHLDKLKEIVDETIKSGKNVKMPLIKGKKKSEMDKLLDEEIEVTA